MKLPDRIQIQMTPGEYLSICDEFEPCEPPMIGAVYQKEQEPRKPDLPNYPTKTAEQLQIETLERENDAAFEKIVKMSRALADFGIDPTQLPGDFKSCNQAESEYRLKTREEIKFGPPITK